MTCYNPTNELRLFLNLASCVEVSLRDCMDLCSFQIAPGGTPTIDSCGCDGSCDGHGWLTIITASAYESLGSDILTSTCDSMLQVEVEAGLYRCYPTSEEGTDLSALTDLSILMVSDMMALRQGLLCCPDTDVLLGAYRSIAPSGGCVGGAWRAVLSLS